ncbi:membrane protein [Rhodopirellula maiorica SM1]|uniref:Membrane protein n=1 Tax=Rhodopirellula maiorica SM1 TaxID=1265738 RepID=M5RNI2_9BACT|nr:hypothetical protein [Rhodopirellula maiorica]EMI20850.1 membrane protein [Rhodopirellula maiorica SM1]
MSNEIVADSDHPRPLANPQRDELLQFRLSTIFVLTLIASILAAFLRPRGNDLMIAGMVTTISCLAFGMLVGKLRPPLMQRVFWGVVVAAMMQAVASNTILLDRKGIYGWPIAAGFAAVVASGNSNLYRRMFQAAVAAATVVAIYMASVPANWTTSIANSICAAIGGALLAVLVEVVNWLQRKTHIPLPITGLALVLSAIVFAAIAPIMIPGW